LHRTAAAESEWDRAAAAVTVAGAAEASALGGPPVGGALPPTTAPVATAPQLDVAAPPPAAATEAEVMGSEEARLRGFRPDEEVLMPLPVWSDSEED